MTDTVKILYIEDNLGDQVLMSEYLDKLQYHHIKLSLSGSLQEASETLHNEAFDLVFLDLSLPDVDGLQTLEVLHDQFPELQVVVISGIQDQRLILGCVIKGALDFVAKKDLSAFQLEKVIRFSLDRVRINRESRHNEMRYRSLFEANPESIVLTRAADGQIISVNEAFTRKFGWSAEECTGKTTVEIGLWNDMEQRREVLRSLPSKGKAHNPNLTFNTKSGEVIPCSLSLSHYTSSGEPYLVGIIVSMEVQEEQKRKLEKERQRYRSLVESAPDLFFYSSAFSAIQYVCPQVKEHLGYEAEEVMGSDFKRYLSPKSLKQFQALEWGTFLKTGERKVLRPFELITKNGQVKPYELYLIPVPDPDKGRIEFVQGVARDISEELETFRLLELSNENNLKALEELKTHQYAIDQHNMVVITDIEGKVKFANENFCEFTGYSKKDLIGRSTRMFNSGLHDKAFFEEMWNTILNGDVWKGHICNRRKNGDLYWLATTIIPRKNSSGKIIEFIALRTDITDLKLTEAALLKSESSLSNILNSNPHNIWAVDLNYQLLSLNDNFRQEYQDFFGEKLERGINMATLVNMSEEMLAQWEERYDLAFSGKTETYYDEIQQPATGESRYLQISIYPTVNEHNEIVGANVFSQDITERQMAKENLRETNRKLKESQRLAKVADWSYNLLTNEFEFSDNLYRVLGLETNEELPRNLRQLLKLAHSSKQTTMLEMYKKALAGHLNSQNNRIIWSPLHSEDQLWLESKLFAETNAGGEVVELYSISREVSEVIHLRQLEAKQKQLFVNLAQNGTTLLKCQSLQSIYENLGQTMFNWFDQEVIVGTAKVVSENPKNRFILNSLKMPGNFKSYFHTLYEALENKTQFPSIYETQRELEQTEVLDFNENLLEKLNFIEAPYRDLITEKFPEFALKAIGINYGNAYHGSCYVLFPHGVPDYYSDQLLEVLANQAATVMELVEYRQELQKNAFVLEESLKAAKAGIFRYDFKAGHIEGDSTFYRQLGMTPEDYGPIPDSETVKRLDEHFLEEMRAKIKDLSPVENGYYQIETRFKGFDNHHYWFEDRAKITQWSKDGEPLEIMGIRTDITRRKEREEQLLLLESTVTNSNEAILITDAEDINGKGPHIIYANEAFEKMTGYQLEEVKGQSPRMLQGVDTSKEEVKKMSLALQNSESVQVELINYHKSGRPYWVTISIVPVKDKRGEVSHFVALERDTTKEQNYRKELEDLLMRFELATRATKVGVWDLDVKNDKLIWDSNMYQLYDVDPKDFNNHLEAWQKTLHPDDYETANQGVMEALNSDSNIFNSQFRVRTKSKVKYIAATANISRNEKGEALRMVGLNWDISEIEESRIEIEKLRQSTQALINSTRDHMWSIDAGFRLLSANDKYLQYLNSISNREIQLHDNILQSSFGEERNKKWREIYERVLRGEELNFDLKETNDQGERIFSVSLYPIYNEAGIITGVACYSFDATETTRYLRTIEQQNRNLKDIAWLQSHVMRAPVARIMGLIEILKEEKEKVGASALEILNLIEDSSLEMDEVIRESLWCVLFSTISN